MRSRRALIDRRCPVEATRNATRWYNSFSTICVQSAAVWCTSVGSGVWKERAYDGEASENHSLTDCLGVLDRVNTDNHGGGGNHPDVSNGCREVRYTHHSRKLGISDPRKACLATFVKWQGQWCIAEKGRWTHRLIVIGLQRSTGLSIFTWRRCSSATNTLTSICTGSGNLTTPVMLITVRRRTSYSVVTNSGVLEVISICQ